MMVNIMPRQMRFCLKRDGKSDLLENDTFFKYGRYWEMAAISMAEKSWPH